jgi:hypothetical protein
MNRRPPAVGLSQPSETRDVRLRADPGCVSSAVLAPALLRSARLTVRCGRRSVQFVRTVVDNSSSKAGADEERDIAPLFADRRDASPPSSLSPPALRGEPLAAPTPAMADGRSGGALPVGLRGDRRPRVLRGLTQRVPVGEPGCDGMWSDTRGVLISERGDAGALVAAASP